MNRVNMGAGYMTFPMNSHGSPRRAVEKENSPTLLGFSPRFSGKGTPILRGGPGLVRLHKILIPGGHHLFLDDCKLKDFCFSEIRHINVNKVYAACRLEIMLIQKVP